MTQAVLAKLARIESPRLRQIMGAAVQHLHAFAHEVQLTEAEAQQACGRVARIGQLTTPAHNEVVLTAGSLGLSALLCLMNNGNPGRQPRPAAHLCRPDGPVPAPGCALLASSGSIKRRPTPSLPILVRAWVKDLLAPPSHGVDLA